MIAAGEIMYPLDPALAELIVLADFVPAEHRAVVLATIAAIARVSACASAEILDDALYAGDFDWPTYAALTAESRKRPRGL